MRDEEREKEERVKERGESDGEIRRREGEEGRKEK